MGDSSTMVLFELDSFRK